MKTKLSRYTLYDGLQMQKFGLSYIWLDYNSGIKDMEIYTCTSNLVEAFPLY